jgi:hypothetical protein
MVCSVAPLDWSDANGEETKTPRIEGIRGVGQ